MDIKTDMVDLVAAFNETRLMALHIDLQTFYYSAANTANAYPVVNEFAESLRGLEVPNIWVAFTKQASADEELLLAKETKTSPTLMSKEYPNSHPDLHPIIAVNQDEHIFYKSDSSALKSSSINPLQEFLQKSAVTTLIVDGVKYNYCVQETAIVAAILGFRVYIPLNATNCPAIDYDLFPKLMTLGIQQEVKDRITFTSTPEITSHLELAKIKMPKAAIG